MIVAAALRTGAQALLGYLLTFAVSHGVHVPVETQTWFVETLMVGGGIALYTALVRLLETSGNPILRALGQVLMLGLSAKQPTGYGALRPADGAAHAGDSGPRVP